MSFRKRIAFYTVSDPIYEPYTKLNSPIVKCVAKGLKMTGEDSRMDLIFIQDDGTEEQSFSIMVPFSKKNVEAELGKLFKTFSI